MANNIGIIGTAVSAVFLLLIAAINILVLVDIYKMWRQVARGGAYEEQKVEDYLKNRGLLARLFRPIIKPGGRLLEDVPGGSALRPRLRHRD